MSSPAHDDTRARVLAVLEAHGEHATSFQILEPSFRYFFDESDAVVAYVEAAGHRVAAGPPVAPPARLGEVTERFVADAARAGMRVVFFGVDGWFLRALREHGRIRFDAIKVGEHGDFDPERYSVDGPVRRSLRAQVNRARNHGVQVRRVVPGEQQTSLAALRAEVETVLGRWLSSRRMSVMRFLVDLHPFVCAEERRYYVAEHRGRAVGFLAAVPVYAKRGWFFEDVIRAPDAPNGTTELLIHDALCHARQEGDGMATLGLAPLVGIPPGPGPHRALRWVLRRCYLHLGFLYGFAGLFAFKSRFRPDAWVPQFLVTIDHPAGARALQAVLTAFAGGGILAFGLDTVRRLAARVPRRVWAAVLTSLAALLVPWTLLLALVDGVRWFGNTSTQVAWVAFDAVMALAVAGLARAVALGMPTARTGATILCGAAMTDVLLTTVQALHLHHDLEGWPAVLVTIGMAGPAIASLVLLLLAGALSVWSPPRDDRPGG